MDKAAGKKVSESRPAVPGYEIGKKLGRGGMGAVYLAERVGDQSKFAVKVMLSKTAVARDSRDAFLREVEVTKSLQHPNIVSFKDSGVVGGAFYFIMEYCSGGNLTEVAHKYGRQLDVVKKARIMLQALSGLEYAHRRNIVHRDLKPENILFARLKGGWVAKISDFGLSKNFEKAGFSGMTATGGYGGTYHYMPREQLTNFKYIQPVSDVWSIGATFYNLLCGNYPREFRQGDDPIEVILRDEIVPLRHRQPDVPPGIAAVIDRAVANEPVDRFQSADEMRQALAKAIGRRR